MEFYGAAYTGGIDTNFIQISNGVHKACLKTETQLETENLFLKMQTLLYTYKAK